MRIAYFDCFSGISGDMAIGAFLDAGLSMTALAEGLSRLKLKGYEIKKRKVRRSGLTGTKFDCIAGPGSHGHRSLKEIITLIDRSRLNEKVRRIARDIFTTIGRAEARVHGISKPGGLRLHELGAVDSLVDIVGTAIAIDKLGIDEVHSSNITLGRAFVKSHHGILPIPAPATLELLKDCPVAISEIGSELVTPTGAGILKALSRGFGWMPEMKISHIGYGAGSRELVDRPNFLRVLIGDAGGPFKQERVFVIEANIDDMSPQVFEYLFERLFKEGALDVYVSTIQMKKTRPAFKLSALAEPAKLERLAAVIFNETTTIGVRFHEAGRFKLERRSVRVKTRFGEVGVKLSKAPADGMLTVSPEYDECARIARAKKIPFKAIHDEAVAAARRMI